MYVPAINQATDTSEIIAFMQQFSFATIVTLKENVPVASHLPFVVTEESGVIILTAHFAKANRQWMDIEKGTVLVIFTEPHAYISPKHYDGVQNVPTWNYIAVHAYGAGKLITETELVEGLMKKMIATYETGYMRQWDGLPETYRSKMLNGIVAFRVVVNDLQVRKKLSQNRSEAEQLRIIESLSQSDDTNEKLIAGYMRHEQETGKK